MRFDVNISRSKSALAEALKLGDAIFVLTVGAQTRQSLPLFDHLVGGHE